MGVDVIKRKFPLRKILKSFEFIIASILLIFLGMGYFLVGTLLNEPDYFREVVWEDQFDQANFDVNFRTPYEKYEVDLSLWRPVDDRLRAMHVSVVRQTITRKIIKEEGQKEYLLSIHTSGLKPDFVCLTHPFGFTKDYGLEKPVGAENLSRYTARIDISNEQADVPFEIQLIIYSWNAYQGDKNQMFGVYAKPEAEELIFNINLPKSVNAYDLQFERFDAQLGSMRYLDVAKLDYENLSPQTFEVRMPQPKAGDGYFIRWID